MAFEVPFIEYTMAFLYSVLVGVLYGIIYDFFRITRIIITGRTGHSKLTLFFDKALHRIPNVKTSYKSSPIKSLIRKFYFVFVFFEDVLFFVISALIMTVFLYQVNYGQLRLYLYAGAVLGFFVYYNTLGRLCTFISGVVVSMVKLICTAFIGYVFLPLLKFTLNTISVPVNKIKYRYVLILNNRKTRKLFAMSEKRFGFKLN